jgi:hypothetical protein
MLNIYLILTFLLIILYIYFSVKNRNKKEDFSLLNGIYSHKYNYDEIYDDFYSYNYDDLFFNYDYYVAICRCLLQYLNSVYNNHLCIGIKNGGHINELLKENMKTTSISKSKQIIDKCKYNYKENDYKYISKFDENPYIFDENTFTHISIIDNELYYTSNIYGLFNNCYKWLILKGYLFIQIYDKKSDLNDQFFKISTNSNLRMEYVYSNQIKEIQNNVKVDEFYLIEKLKLNNKERTNHHHLYYYDNNYIDSILKELNFEFKDKIGLTKGESILIYQKK